MDVPLIDLTRWFDGDVESRRALAHDVDRACQDIGFLLVTGHGVPQDLAARLREQALTFFRLPFEEKAAIRSHVGGRGWIAQGDEANGYIFGMDTPPDLKESLTEGAAVAVTDVPAGHEDSYLPNVYPTQVPGLAPILEAYAAECIRLADALLEIFAVALELDNDYFTSRCASAPSTLNINRYPAMSEVRSVQTNQFRIGPHTDFGTITILDRQPGYGGLQVEDPDGGWIDAPHVPGGLLINVGDLMARWTGDRWRSTVHRVLPPDPGAPAEELTSLIFFHEADPWAVVETLPGAAAGPTRYEPVSAGQFLADKIAAITVAA